MSFPALFRGLLLMHLLGLLLLLLGLSTAQAQASVADTWNTNAGTANGFLQLAQDSEGRLSGTLLGRPLTGQYSSGQSEIAFVVGSPGAPTHLFFGTRASLGTQDAMWGIGMVLRAGQAAFGAATGHFIWEARRGAKSVPPPTGITTSPESTWVDLSGLHLGSNPRAELRLQQSADGELGGSWNGDSVLGHFSQGDGSVGLVRLVAGVPAEALASFGAEEPFTNYLVALTPEAAQRNGALVRHWDLALRGAGNLAGRWQINGNGWPGELDLTQEADGRIAGTIYGGEPVQGFYSRSERRMVLLRGPLKRPIQAFVGDVSADGERWQGQLYTLDTGASGGSYSRNVFAFAAQRYGPAPSLLPAVPVTQGSAPRLPRWYRFYNRPAEFQNTQMGWLDFSTIALDNQFDGTFYGDPAFGHFAAATGVLAMVRSRADVPMQFFVGQAQAWPRQPEADVPRFVGRFYALSAEGGALPSRMSFGWSANWVNCGSECPAY